MIKSLSFSAAVAMLLAVCLAPAQAQSYREIRDDEQGPIVEDRGVRTRIGAILRNGRFNAPNDEEDFNKYFRWRINSLTWSELHGSLPDIRRELKRQTLKYAGDATVADLHVKVNDLLLEKCQAFAFSDEFHPLVRTNAMLIVGMLDKKEPDVQGRNNQPLDKAFPVLLKAVNDTALHDAVRAAAITGLESHAGVRNQIAATLPPDRQKELVDALVKLLETENPPEGKDLNGLLWLRYRAADILGQVAAQWPEANSPRVAKALYLLAADSRAPLSHRIRAAYGLGAIDANGLKGAGTPARDMAFTLGELAWKVSEAPAASVESYQFYLKAIDKGFSGVAPGRGLRAASTDTEVSEVASRVKSLVDTLLARDTDQGKIDKLRSQAADLQAWLQQQAPPPAQASSVPAASVETDETHRR